MHLFKSATSSWFCHTLSLFCLSQAWFNQRKRLNWGHLALASFRQVIWSILGPTQIALCKYPLPFILQKHGITSFQLISKTGIISSNLPHAVARFGVRFQCVWEKIWQGSSGNVHLFTKLEGSLRDFHLGTNGPQESWYRVIESLRLEQTLRVTKSNH